MTILDKYLFLYLILLTLTQSQSKKSSSTRRDQTDSIIAQTIEYPLTSGFKLHLYDKKSSSTLIQWAKELDISGGTVSHQNAVSRENQVVSLINQGIWTYQSYHDYQRFAAGTGNVDSSRLLMEYGLGYSLSEITHGKSKSSQSKLFQAVLTCNVLKFNDLIQRDEMLLHVMTDDGITLLMAAAYSGCESILMSLLTEDIHDIDAVALNGLNALMIASSLGYIDIIRHLVKHGADINAKHKFAYSTALHMAAELNQTKSIEMLCRLGIDQTALTSTGSTALHTAASVCASKEVIKVLVVNCNSDVTSLLNRDTTPLYLASQFGCTQTVEALLELGSDVSFKMPITSYKGHYHVSLLDKKTLFDEGINSEAGNGAEAIHAAAEEGHPQVVELLLKHGADINSLSMGASPLHLAAQYNRVDVLRVLIRYGADLDIQSLSDGATPLYYAVGHGHSEIVKLLLASNASVTKTQRRSNGFPLLYAVLRERHDIVKLILDHSMLMSIHKLSTVINQRTKKSDNLSAIHAAVIKGNIKIFRLLLSFNSSYCEPGPDDEFIPYSIVRVHRSDMFKALIRHVTTHTSSMNSLLESRCDFKELLYSRSPVDNSTVFQLAVQFGLTEIVHELIEYIKKWKRSSKRQNTRDVQVNSMHSDKSSERNVYQLINDPWITEYTDKLTNSMVKIIKFPLLLAVQSNSAQTVRLILDYCAYYISDNTNFDVGKDVINRVSIIISSNGKVTPMTPLLTAIDTNNEKIVKLLLTRRKDTGNKLAADPNFGISDIKHGILQSPLLFAVVRGIDAKIVKYLLDAGANCDINVASQSSSLNSSKKKHGDTMQTESLVDIARKKRKFDVLNVLISHKNCNQHDQHIDF